MRNSVRLGLGLLFMVTLLARHPAALADGATGDRAKARTHFTRGTRLYKDAQYDQAIVEYQAAYSALPAPDFLFNIAQAYRLKNDAPKALEYYNRYLTLAPSGGAADEARTNIAVLTKQVEAARAEAEAARAKAADAQKQVVLVVPSPDEPAVAPAPVPLYKKWWLWTAAGGVVVIALGVGLGVGLSHAPSAPSVSTTDGTLRPF